MDEFGPFKEIILLLKVFVIVCKPVKNPETFKLAKELSNVGPVPKLVLESLINEFIVIFNVPSAIISGLTNVAIVFEPEIDKTTGI